MRRDSPGCRVRLLYDEHPSDFLQRYLVVAADAVAAIEELTTTLRQADPTFRVGDIDRTGLVVTAIRARELFSRALTVCEVHIERDRP